MSDWFKADASYFRGQFSSPAAWATSQLFAPPAAVVCAFAPRELAPQWQLGLCVWVALGVICAVALRKGYDWWIAREQAWLRCLVGLLGVVFASMFSVTAPAEASPALLWIVGMALFSALMFEVRWLGLAFLVMPVAVRFGVVPGASARSLGWALAFGLIAGLLFTSIERLLRPLRRGQQLAQQLAVEQASERHRLAALGQSERVHDLLSGGVAVLEDAADSADLDRVRRLVPLIRNRIDEVLGGAQGSSSIDDAIHLARENGLTIKFDVAALSVWPHAAAQHVGRLVWELTCNQLRHASKRSELAVTVDRLRTAIELEVVGAGPSTPGRGLQHLMASANASGGTVDHRPHSDGFRLGVQLLNPLARVSDLRRLLWPQLLLLIGGGIAWSVSLHGGLTTALLAMVPAFVSSTMLSVVRRDQVALAHRQDLLRRLDDALAAPRLTSALLQARTLLAAEPDLLALAAIARRLREEIGRSLAEIDAVAREQGPVPVRGAELPQPS